MNQIEVKDSGNQAHALQMHRNGSTKAFVPGVYIIHVKGKNNKVETTKFPVVH